MNSKERKRRNDENKLLRVTETDQQTHLNTSTMGREPWYKKIYNIKTEKPNLTSNSPKKPTDTKVIEDE